LISVNSRAPLKNLYSTSHVVSVSRLIARRLNRKIVAPSVHPVP